MADYSSEYKNVLFSGHSGTSLTVGLNLGESQATRKDAPEQFLFVETNDRGSESFAVLSRGEAHRLRNHLTELLGVKEKPEPKVQVVNVETPAPVIEDRAVDAIAELAYQLDLFVVDDLVDALNRHSAAIEGFNK